MSASAIGMSACASPEALWRDACGETIMDVILKSSRNSVLTRVYCITWDKVMVIRFSPCAEGTVCTRPRGLLLSPHGQSVDYRVLGGGCDADFPQSSRMRRSAHSLVQC